MRNKIHFHIGCTYAKEPILKCLIDQEFEIVIIDEIGIKPSEVTVPYYCVFGKTYDEILLIIHKIIDDRNIEVKNCFFFTLAEGSVDLLNQLLKDFNKSPISRYEGTLRDKYWVRKRLEACAIERLPYHSIAKNPSEIPDPLSIYFPFIVKPIGSMASRNVFKVFNQDELQKACLEIFTMSKTFIETDHGEIVVEDTYKQLPFAVIESCLYGEKLSFETLVIQGEVRFCAVTSKYDYENDFFYERADIVDPTYFNEEQNQKLNLYVKKIVDALEIVSSVLHIEVFFDRENFVFHLIEVNFRMGGDNIHELVSKAYGVDIVAKFLEISADPSNSESSTSIVPSSEIWIAFYFMTESGGQFKARSHSVFGNKIEWDFSDEEKVSKFTTSKFYKLGTVVFSSPKEKMNSRLEHLLKEPELYYSISKDI